MYAPSSSATPSTPAVSTPAPPFPPTLYHGSREKRLLFSVWRIRGNCRRRIGRIVGVRNETVRDHENYHTFDREENRGGVELAL